MQSDLSGWNFAGQNMSHVSIFGSNLDNASFRGAKLVGTVFGALSTFVGTDFTDAVITGLSFPPVAPDSITRRNWFFRPPAIRPRT